MTRAPALLALVVALAAPGLASAAPPSIGVAAPTTTSDLQVVARYVFERAAIRRGVNEILVRIENVADEPASGRVVVGASMADSTGAEAEYRVDGHATVFLHLPVQVADSFSARVRVERAGVVVANEEVRMGGEHALHIVDLQEASHLFGLNGVWLGARTPKSYGAAGVEVQVETPLVDAATGDLLLPKFAIGWAGVDVAVITSDRLAQIGGEELESLSAYVLGGGTLAVSLTRDDDLRSGTLPLLLGGVASRVPPRPEQLRPSPPNDVNHPRFTAGTSPPARLDSTTFTSYAGGNLAPSPLGAVAQYGLGRVFLLGFDLTAPGVGDDVWVHFRMLDAARAKGVRSPAAHGVLDGDDEASRARNLLNPQRQGNWGVGLSAILLCVYAVIAGPVAFSRAKSKNKPLRALVWLPFFSLAMFLVIVIIGVTARGSGTRARRLTFVDLGAGMDRGVGRRFRAILFPDAATFDAAPDRRTSFIRRLTRDGSDPSVQIVDRDGLFIRGVNVAPWETATLREEGLFTVGAGISTSVAENGDVMVKNRTGRTLSSVLVKLPDETARFFTDVAPESVVIAAATGPSERPWRRFTDPSNAESSIASAFAEGGAADDANLFSGVAGSFRREVEWLPAGTPVVIATFDEPPGKSDTGASIEFDRTLLRVVGVGGEP